MPKPNNTSTNSILWPEGFSDGQLLTLQNPPSEVLPSKGTRSEPQFLDFWTGDSILAEARLTTAGEAFQFLAWGRGIESRGRMFAAYLMFSLKDEAFRDIYAELAEIIRFYYSPLGRSLPEPKVITAVGTLGIPA